VPEGTTYLQVRRDGAQRLKVVRATQNRPEAVAPGCVVVKIRLRIPAAAFAPLTPEAVVTVPENLVQPVEVEPVEVSPQPVEDQ
jgi:hypothetical protein